MEEDDNNYRGKGGRQRSSGSTEDRHRARRRTRDTDSPTPQPREKIHRSEKSFGDRTSRHTSSPGEGTSRDFGDRRHAGDQLLTTSADRSASTKNSDRPRSLTRRNRYEIIHSKPATIITKKGTDGTKVRLSANYFKVTTRPEWNIYQYHVDFSPEIELNRLKQGILSNFKSMLGGYLFDGAQLYVTRQLREEKIELKVSSRQNVEYTVTIKYVGIITMSQWQSLQVLNLILRRAMQGLQLQLVGKNFYDALAKIDVREFNLQLWPGYITSIRQHEQDILVCAEISHKFMRTETLLDIMKQVRRENNWQEEFRRKAIGMIVLTDYTNKTYRIDDVDFNSNPQTTFNKKGVPTSYIEYYLTKYQIRIRDLQQPLLLSQNKENRVRSGEINTILLIPELCRACGLTDDMKKNFNLTKRLANTTRPDPRSRVESLIEFNNRLQRTKESQEILRDWNMSLDKGLIELTGRTFPSEKITLKNNVKFDVNARADWNDAFKNDPRERMKNEMYTSIALQNWAVITPNNLARDTNSFVDNIIHVAREIGMEIAQPNILPDDRAHSYQRELDRVADDDPQLIMVILFSNAADKYSIIKKRCCIERGVPTQVVTKRVLTNKNLTIHTKVAIQMNAKIGGVPWLISLPLNSTMFVGFDICKSKRDRNVAFAAIVAAMSPKDTTSYFSTVMECNANDNLFNHLNVGVTKAIRFFQQKCNLLPSKIILYRTSVGDGSIKQMFEHEVKELVKTLEVMYENSKVEKPKITFIMVSKTINTKFFAKSNNGMRNPDPGTIVDDVVTLPERYDFYLISQFSRQGTASPTSYNVLYDTFNLSPSRLQLLTYKLCHLYYNWSGTTKVPAVCQYAKKLASLVGDHLHVVPSESLEKFLYFI